MGGISAKLPATVETALSVTQLRTAAPATEEEMGTAAMIGMPTVVVEMATAMEVDMGQTPAHGAVGTSTRVQAPLTLS